MDLALCRGVSFFGCSFGEKRPPRERVCDSGEFGALPGIASRGAALTSVCSVLMPILGEGVGTVDILRRDLRELAPVLRFILGAFKVESFLKF